MMVGKTKLIQSGPSSAPPRAVSAGACSLKSGTCSPLGWATGRPELMRCAAPVFERRELRIPCQAPAPGIQADAAAVARMFTGETHQRRRVLRTA
jgi:hypothetical protein